MLKRRKIQNTVFAKESFIVDDYKEYNKNVNNNDNYNNYYCDNFNNNKTINRITITIIIIIMSGFSVTHSAGPLV